MIIEFGQNIRENSKKILSKWKLLMNIYSQNYKNVLCLDSKYELNNLLQKNLKVM